jgi:hypothetical protein
MESQRVHSAAAESIMNIPIISSQVVSSHCNNLVDFSVTHLLRTTQTRDLSLSLSLSPHVSLLTYSRTVGFITEFRNCGSIERIVGDQQGLVLYLC